MTYAGTMRLGAIAALAAIWSGCGGQSSDDGEVGGHCYPNATCNVGLTCAAGICMPVDAAIVDAASDARVDAAVDAPVDALVCTDTSIEPNDTIATAFVTPVATLQNTISITNLMICPAGDKDDFAVTITAANQNLEMILDFDPAAPIGMGSILNSGGVPIANATMVTGMPYRQRAYTPNLPTGVYYAAVYAGLGDVTRYQLTLNVTGP
jgi:hypothetical protein